MRARALAALARLEANPDRTRDWKAAVATYEDLTGPMSELISGGAPEPSGL